MLSLEDDEFLVLLNEAGAVVGYSKSPDEIQRLMDRVGLDPYWLTPLSEDRLLRQANPGPRPKKLPLYDSQIDLSNVAYSKALQAQKRTTLPTITWEDIKQIDFEEACETLKPIFEEANHAARDEIAKTYGILTDNQVNSNPLTWVTPKKGWLSENAKLHKPDKRSNVKTVALGLSLIPEAGIFRGKPEAWYETGSHLNIEDPAVNITPQGNYMSPVKPFNAPVPTLCPGSSAQCRSTCLVFVGQNQSSVGPNYVKWAKSKALTMHPHAFVRILLDAVLRYNNSFSQAVGGKEGLKFARLNVFSDIPWETVTPWMFELFDRTKKLKGKQFHSLNFYDYTKVGCRPFLPNYDLTYSYAGTKGSLKQANEELASGRNVAIVFAAQSYSTYLNSLFKKKATKGIHKKSTRYLAKEAKAMEDWRKYNPLPRVVQDPLLNNGQPMNVVDADYSDIRPLDPAGGVVVGLRWKPPTLKKVSGVKGRHELSQAPFGFVVIGRIFRTMDGPVFILPDTPLSQPTTANKERAVEGYLKQVIYDRQYSMPERIRPEWEVFGKTGIRPDR